jgi:hypothetical protein
MPFIYLKDGHYVANRHKGNVGMIMGGCITIFDESYYFHSDEKRTYINAFENVASPMDIPMDKLYNFNFVEDDTVIDELIAACLYKEYYVTFMNVVIDNIAKGDFSDLIHDDIGDVLWFVNTYGNSNGTMGEINIEVLNFEYNCRLYNALIAKVGNEAHIYANCRNMSTKRNLIGKAYLKCENFIDDTDNKMSYISNLNYGDINFLPISTVCK